MEWISYIRRSESIYSSGQKCCKELINGSVKISGHSKFEYISYNLLFVMHLYSSTHIIHFNFEHLYFIFVNTKTRWTPQFNCSSFQHPKFWSYEIDILPFLVWHCKLNYICEKTRGITRVQWIATPRDCSSTGD